LVCSLSYYQRKTRQLNTDVPRKHDRSYIQKSSAVAEIGDRLATVDITKKWGSAVSLSVGGAESSSNTMSPRPWPTPVPSGMPDNIVLDGYPAPPWKGVPPLFRPCLFWPNGWIHPASSRLATILYPAVWPQQTSAEKWGLLCPFLGCWVPI